MSALLSSIAVLLAVCALVCGQLSAIQPPTVTGLRRRALLINSAVLLAMGCAAVGLFLSLAITY